MRKFAIPLTVACALAGTSCVVARLETVIKMPPAAAHNVAGFKLDAGEAELLCRRVTVYTVKSPTAPTAPPTTYLGQMSASGDWARSGECVWGMPVDPGVYSLYATYRVRNDEYGTADGSTVTVIKPPDLKVPGDPDAGIGGTGGSGPVDLSSDWCFSSSAAGLTVNPQKVTSSTMSMAPTGCP